MENVIASYTRQEAIEDGLLVDVTNTAEVKEAGFRIPVCLTKSVHELVEVPECLEGINDYAGRLWDVCYMATMAFRRAQEGNHIVPFKVVFATTIRRRKTVDLWLVFNEYEGFTIMRPEDY